MSNSPIAAQSFSACLQGPFEKEVVDSGDPIYLNICWSPPPCSQPLAPVVLDDPGKDLVRAQGLVLEATVPGGLVADKVKWHVEYVDAQGARVFLYEHESAEDIQAGVAGPYTVRFGAPGLLENTVHQFRVSFRRDSDDYWLCWSNRTAGTTGTFSDFGPTAPVTVEVEDDFRRATTTERSQGGDGIGPEAVWDEMVSPAKIVSDGTVPSEAGELSAFLSASTLQRYGTEASDPHTYAEGLFRTAQPGSGFYNIDLFTKEHISSQMPMIMNNYFLKLAFGTRGCDGDPVLFLLRAFEESEDSTCENNEPNPNLPDDAALVIPDESQAKCNARPPLDEEDTDDSFDPNRSEPVWLRIEAGQSAEEDPLITATVAWNCPDDEIIDNCTNVCKLTRIDNVSSDMLLVEGEWGFWVHDAAYYLDFFRAGSDPFE